MIRHLISSCYLIFPTLLYATNSLPKDFVYLSDIDPTVVQEMRYFGSHNFIGRPIDGYEAGECILTREAAAQLAKVQVALRQSNLSLKVYDCYRPQRAVDDFIAWSKQPQPSPTQQEFMPNVPKRSVFPLGYVAYKSGHSRGSTVDLTIVPLPIPAQPTYRPGQKLIACTAPYSARFKDNSIDMGTGFDCFDPLSHSNSTAISAIAKRNRKILLAVMTKNGFKVSDKEWWHFTLIHEPFPEQYFNFPVRTKPV
ncbi:MAG: M15 family metallopeptidase [Pseudomonadota bacterium]|nr:M15 family metallopeptidase [Pseudomonadota bacterium]